MAVLSAGLLARSSGYANMSAYSDHDKVRYQLFGSRHVILSSAQCRRILPCSLLLMKLDSKLLFLMKKKYFLVAFSDFNGFQLG